SKREPCKRVVHGGRAYCRIRRQLLPCVVFRFGATAALNGELAKHSLQSSDLLHAVIGALSEGLAVFGEDTTLVFCNEAYKACIPLFADISVPGLRYDVMLREAVARNAISTDLRERIDR